MFHIEDTVLCIISKQKPTNVGRIALERLAGGKTFDHAGIRSIDLPIPN